MLTDAELVAIWERGASVYYKDHLAFARAVCVAERERYAKASEHDPNPVAWAMLFEAGDYGPGDWAELGEKRPRPEGGFTAYPLYDRATLDEAIAKERERIARDGLALVRGQVFE